MDITPKFEQLPAEQEIIQPPTVGDSGSQVIGGFMTGPSGMTQAQKNLNALNAISITTTDDIQAAINTLTKGGTVFLGIGTWTVKTDIVIPNNIQLIGSGAENTFIDFANTAHAITVTGVPGVTTGITGFSLQQITVKNSTAAAAIEITGASDFSLQFLQIQNCGGKGIRIQKSWRYYCNTIYLNGNTGVDFTVINDATQAPTQILLTNIISFFCSATAFFIQDTAAAASGVALVNCQSISAGVFGGAGDGFHIDMAGVSLTNCVASLTKDKNFNFLQGGCKVVGCTSDSYITMTDLSMQTAANSLLDPNSDVVVMKMQNTSGSTMTQGDVVVIKAVATAQEITNTIAVGDNKVFGMVMTGTVFTGDFCDVLVRGRTTKLKANGTIDIAIGDYLCTYSVQGVSQKAAAGNMVFAMALEAYTANDSLGVIDAILITPRLI